jgi:hypothetical protein
VTPWTSPDAAASEPHEPVGSTGTPATWCGQCGKALAHGHHEVCARRAALEPPRWCAHCRRRLKVQVTPGAWTATCVVHGSVERSTWG